MSGAVCVSLNFKPDGDKHLVMLCIDGFQETLCFIQKLDPTAHFLPVHKGSPHSPLKSSTSQIFPALMAELGVYLHIQNMQDTCRPSGSDKKGKQQQYKSTWGSALISSTMDVCHILRNIKGDLDSRHVVINRKFMQELDTRSDLAIISCHNDLDPAGLKFVATPFLWTVEERLWKDGKNLHWKNLPQPDFCITLRGAKETHLTDPAARAKYGFADADQSLKRIFHIGIPSQDFSQIRLVWESAFASNEAQNVLGRNTHLLKTGMSGPRCEQSK